MADNSSSVASVAIVVILIVAFVALYFIFGRGGASDGEIDVDIDVPPIENVVPEGSFSLHETLRV